MQILADKLSKKLRGLHGDVPQRTFARRLGISVVILNKRPHTAAGAFSALWARATQARLPARRVMAQHYLHEKGERPYSEDLRSRLKAHNAGQSVHTAKYKPWSLVTYIAFSDKHRALDFEHYLKTGSGKAFANKRLW